MVDTSIEEWAVWKVLRGKVFEGQTFRGETTFGHMETITTMTIITNTTQVVKEKHYT